MSKSKKPLSEMDLQEPAAEMQPVIVQHEPLYLLPNGQTVWWGSLSEEEKAAIREQFEEFRDVE
jgi:hypothetical protein